MIVETEAIVLQTRKYSDTSKIVVVFTKEYGKVSLIAKGAFTVKSKFGGTLEPLSYIYISFYKKNSTDLHLLKSVEFVTQFNNIKKKYDTIVAGLVTAEIVNYTQNENFVNTNLFERLAELLQILNKDIGNPFSYCTNFLFCLANNLGFLINFNVIETLPQLISSVKISLSDATILDYNSIFCASKDIYTFKYATIKKVANYKSDMLQEDLVVELNNNEFIEIVNFFANFFAFHLGKKYQIRNLSLLNS